MITSPLKPADLRSEQGVPAIQRLCYPESEFGGFTHVDGSVLFFLRVNSLLNRDCRVLDVGCGRGEYAADPVEFRRSLRVLRGKCREVIGIDVEETGRQNPCIDEFRLIEGPTWPMEDVSVDLCIGDHVLEHVTDPEAFFSECRRVIKPGGFVCVRTPNRFGYVAIASSCIPKRLHARLLNAVQGRRDTQDVFPAFYRCNTVRRLKVALHNAGFEPVVYSHESEPMYLSFSEIAYRVGVTFQRHAFPSIRNVLFAFGRRRP